LLELFVVGVEGDDDDDDDGDDDGVSIERDDDGEGNMIGYRKMLDRYVCLMMYVCWMERGDEIGWEKDVVCSGGCGEED
jgi:hypothetical protein